MFTRDLRRALAAAWVLSGLCLGGCGGDGAGDGAAAPGSARFALLTSGPVSDAGWYAGGYEGLLLLRDSLGAAWCARACSRPCSGARWVESREPTWPSHIPATFAEGMSAGRGFIALAVVVLGRWHPLGVLAGALLFGATSALQFSLQALEMDLPYQLFLALPYVVTLLALAGWVGRARAPAALGRPWPAER